MRSAHGALFEAVPDALFVTDAEGRICAVNQEGVRLSGYERVEDLLGQPIERLVPERLRARHAEDRAEFARDAARRPMGQGRPLHLRTAAGALIPVEISLSPFEGGVIAAVRDVTERVRAETRIRRQAARLEAANQELQAFGHAVTHDLRAPLRTIRGFSELLLEDVGPDLHPDDRGLLERIHAGSLRMAELLTALGTLSQVSSVPLDVERVDLVPIAEHALQGLHARHPGRSVEVTLPQRLEATGQPALLANLVENLLRNAWKFTAEKPVAHIELGREGTAFFVRDDGVGFDSAIAEELFLPFRRGHTDAYEGTGIGLATVARIAQRHGGRAWAEGTPGEGATVWFELPDA